MTLAKDSYSDMQFLCSIALLESILLSFTFSFMAWIVSSRSASIVSLRWACRSRFCCHKINFVSSRSQSSTSRTKLFFDFSIPSGSGVLEDNSARKLPYFWAQRVNELRCPPVLPKFCVSRRYCSVSVAINGASSFETMSICCVYAGSFSIWLCSINASFFMGKSDVLSSSHRGLCARRKRVGAVARTLNSRSSMNLRWIGLGTMTRIY